MLLTTYRVAPGLKTAALEGALLVFHPGSGATVALTDQLLQVFLAIQAGETLDALSLLPESLAHEADTVNIATDVTANETLDSCLRLLRQHQLITAQP